MEEEQLPEEERERERYRLFFQEVRRERVRKRVKVVERARVFMGIDGRLVSLRIIITLTPSALGGTRGSFHPFLVMVSFLLFLSKIRFFSLLPPCVLSRSIDLPPNSPSRTAQILSLSLEGEVNLFLMVIKGQSGSSSKPRENRVEVARNSKLKGKDPVVDEEMEEDEEGRSLSGDDSEESVFDGDAYEDVEDDEYEDEIYEDEEFEDELCQRTVKRAPKKRQSAKSRRVISYDEVEEEEDIEDEDGEYMDGGYEDEGEDVVVRVQKRGKSWKEVGQNALKKKAHLQMMRKRRREDYDDVDEGRRPVKKTILPATKQMGRKFDETGVAKGKPPAKQKAIRGNNRRMFVRVPIPKHPMSRGEYAKFHGVVVATQRANCGRKQPSVICRTDAFSKIIAAFDESRRSCVRKMGFGGMLDLKISKLPRKLCYWLMSRLDGGNSYLVGGDGHVLSNIVF
ncbi:uncharacterized protein [Spinacia oleracea]|uniref:Uncharacterized protein n=1 Tax=Spinacia oleracea TaxID=3562 RepID=A0ABM3RRN3_SPIOL|nr:uncharacterized protein LOC110791026 [Spinacia oleracea]